MKRTMVIILLSACFLLTGCVMFKANSDGVWMGVGWSDAGAAASKVLPQKIEDIATEYVKDNYTETKAKERKDGDQSFQQRRGSGKASCEILSSSYCTILPSESMAYSERAKYRKHPHKRWCVRGSSRVRVQRLFSCGRYSGDTSSSSGSRCTVFCHSKRTLDYFREKPTAKVSRSNLSRFNGLTRFDKLPFLDSLPCPS